MAPGRRSDEPRRRLPLLRGWARPRLPSCPAGRRPWRSPEVSVQPLPAGAVSRRQVSRGARGRRPGRGGAGPGRGSLAEPGSLAASPTAGASPPGARLGAAAPEGDPPCRLEMGRPRLRAPPPRPVSRAGRDQLPVHHFREPKGVKRYCLPPCRKGSAASRPHRASAGVSSPLSEHGRGRAGSWVRRG